MSTPDQLVPDPEVIKEFGITSMTLYRWTHDDALGFPPPISIRRRNFRSRHALDEFKDRMLKKALAERGAA